MDIEKEIEALRERNRRVEGEKAWEVSYFRSFCLLVGTYLVSVLVLKMIQRENFLLEALVPTFGYFL